MTKNTPQTTPEIDKIVQAAKKNEDVDLQTAELETVIEKSAELRERTKQLTHRELQHLNNTIREEEEQHTDELIDENKEKLQQLRTEIDADIASKTPTVNDMEVITDPTKPKTFMDNIKAFGAAINLSSIGGSILRFFKSIQKTLAGIGIPVGDTAALDKVEENFNAFFGTSELRELIASNLQKSGNGVEIRKGSGDVEGYLKMQADYRTKLSAKLAEIAPKGPDGKSLEIPSAMRSQIESTFTFKGYVEEKVKAYVIAYPMTDVATEKRRITTLKGISNSEKPSVVDA